ncbi:MAG: glycoside hydrolase family 2 TIM barrel-domain containing protein [Polaribacter sp.]|nr:glycoside hydrolase family 2 TIM barrel-domain containing protein [Polaribacter sp.]MDG2150816.1 glycoside hydrolase family 2 TIM barrel-domain containing protein [Polaribacter sp.]
MKHLKNIFFGISLIIFQFNSNGQDFHKKNAFSLNGTWEIIFDDNNQGIENDWYLDENFGKQNFQTIAVPSCWEETKKNYEGVGIYRTKFTIPKDWSDKIIQLNFEASNYKTEIWINDQVVGFHEGGYTPFSFRIDKLIKAGEQNTLVVRVVSPIILTDKYIDGLGRQEVPMWRGAITGGIWQSVSIEAKGSLGVKDVFIEPNINTNTSVFNIEIENTKTDVEKSEVIVKILSKDGKEVASKTETLESLPGKNTVQWNLHIPNARYWSTKNPYLYKAQVTVKKEGEISDEWETKFGMREFTVVDDQFYMNGEPIYLKATFFEGLYPVGLAYPDSREMAIKEIKLAKEAGFNMIRPWRKPAPQMWLDLCDEMGVLTVGSLVIECMYRPISTPRLQFVVENELRKTITTNRNRTCIVQWELFNEINRPILAQMLNSMSVLARELDPTRMILDESGGWGEGANIYLPFERTPKKFNDIHHYSGSQVDENEFNGYLATAKTNKDKNKLGLAGVKSYGKNVVSGIMSYVSELGYGSTPDLISNIKEFETKGNPIVAPSIYHRELNDGYIAALQKIGYDKIYPNVQDFYLEQQKMHGIANKRMLEATRLNSTIAGYCVHALVGGDWVLGAGLLDLWRNPKTLVYEMTKEANQEQITPIRILPRNVYAEKGAQLEVYGVSELTSEKVTVFVKISSKKGIVVYQNNFSGEFSNGISTLLSTQLNTLNLEGTYTVNVEVKNKKGKVITSNYQSFDVFQEKQLKTPSAKIAVVDFDNTLSEFLKSKNINFVSFNENLDKNIPVLVGKTSKKDKKYKEKVQELRTFAKKGGYVVFFEVLGKRVAGFERELKEIEAETLPLEAEMQQKWATRGGWAAKSHVVSKHQIFKGLPTEIIMHGVYENVHPEVSISKIKGDYIAGLIGYDHFPNNEIMRRHFNGPGEVWWAADVLETQFGEGKMLLSTLRIIEFLDTDPVAEKLLYNIIDYISK